MNDLLLVLFVVFPACMVGLGFVIGMIITPEDKDALPKLDNRRRPRD